MSRPTPATFPDIKRYPYYDVHDWEDHQTDYRPGKSMLWIRVYTKLLVLPKYLFLPIEARGVLHSMWLLRGLTGHRLPRDPRSVSLALGLRHSRHMLGHLIKLERSGFLVPRTHQKRRDKKRREKNPPTPQLDPSITSPEHQPPRPQSINARPLTKGWAKLFESDFWPTWHNKTHKAAAIKAWTAVGKRHLPDMRKKTKSDQEALDALMGNVAEVQQSRNGRLGWDKIHPASWLNAEMFDDVSITQETK